MGEDDDSLLSPGEIDDLLKSLASSGEEEAVADEKEGQDAGAQVPGGDEGAPAESKGAARSTEREQTPAAPAASERALAAWQRANPHFGKLLGVKVTCTMQVGAARIELGKLLEYGPSSHIVLDQKVDELLTLRVNGVPFARGIVVKVQGKYGIRITQLTSPKDTERGKHAR